MGGHGRPPFDRGHGGAPHAVPLPPPEDLGPDEELVAGRRPVEEAFVARRPAIRLLVVPHRRAALEKLVLHATNLRIPIVEVEGGSLTALAGFDGHQGVALVVEPRRFASLDDVLAKAAEREEPPFVLVLDSLEDPHNVGTLLRSAEAAGVHGVVFPTHRQAPLSPSAVKASAGAIEHLLLCPVDDLPGALSDLHARGLRVAGAEGDSPLTARQSDLRGPLAIVVGSEGQGLGPAVRRRCDLFMRIPMKGNVGSLNAAVAGSILLFEALAQRDPNAMPSVVPHLADGAHGTVSRPAHVGDQPAPPAKRRLVPPPKGVAVEEPDTGFVRPVKSVVAEDGDTTPPAPRRRKFASPDSSERASLASIASDETATAKPATRESVGRKRASTEPDEPKRRDRKGLSTEPAEAAETGVAPAEDDLLPADSPRKRRSNAQ